MWSEKEIDNQEWCKRNKVYDEITDAEIDELLNREDPGDDEAIRLNGKYVWETAKRVCNYINAHEDLIHITSFGEYKVVMKKVMMVIRGSPRGKEKEANSEKGRE